MGEKPVDLGSPVCRDCWWSMRVILCRESILSCASHGSEDHTYKLVVFRQQSPVLVSTRPFTWIVSIQSFLKWGRGVDLGERIHHNLRYAFVIACCKSSVAQCIVCTWCVRAVKRGRERVTINAVWVDEWAGGGEESLAVKLSEARGCTVGDT